MPRTVLTMHEPAKAMPLRELVSTLQLAIGPVILISGIGLLLLSMTNRLARVIDRARELTEVLAAGTADHSSLIAQLRVLWRRAVLVRRAIALTTMSVLFVALLIITLFVGTLWQLHVAALLIALFTACLCCLVAALAFFLQDINLTLRALGMELPDEAKRVR